MCKKLLYLLVMSIMVLTCVQGVAFSANYPPTLTSVNPNSGIVQPGVWKTFTCVYADPNGANNLAMCELLVNTTASNSGGARLIYSRSANKLYMRNNAGVLTTGVTKGAAGTLQSENAMLDCAGTTVSTSGNNLTVNWKVQFKSIMAGKNCNLYMQASDALGAVKAWTDKGNYSINAVPTLTSVSPASGSVATGAWKTFTCVYSDLNGATDLAMCELLINATASNNGGARLLYSRSANKLYMRNNAGVLTAGVTKGAAGTLQSENAILDCAGTTVTTSGNNLTVNWKMQFKSTMAGKNCNLFMQASDASGAVKTWTDKGDIKVNASPTVVSVSPASGSVAAGAWKSFTCVYSDPNGATDLAMCELLINATASNNGGARLLYSRSANKLYMRNNAGVLTAGVTKGAAGTLQSENAILDCAGTTVTTSGNNLTVNWKMQFKSTMTGKNCNIFMQASDTLGTVKTWMDKGDFSITANASPSVVSVSPASGSVAVGAWKTFTCIYSDPNGATDLAMCELLVNTTASNNGGARLMYSRSDNKLYMRNNAGALTAGIIRGTATTIQSENAILDCGGTTVTPNGNNLTVNWKVQFRSPMAGKNCNLYMQASDALGAVKSWTDKGNFSITAPPPTIANVYTQPTSLTLLAGTTYTFARANAVDSNGLVASSTTSFTWSSQNTSIVSVANKGLTDDGNYCGATISALSVGQTTVTVAAGGKTQQIAVKVVANPTAAADRFLEVPVDQAVSVPIALNGFRYAYFYGEPGKEYRFKFDKVEGYQNIWISSDPSFTDTAKVINSGNNSWNGTFTSDIVTPNGYGAYYIKMKANGSVNYVDVTVSYGSLPRVFSVVGVWSKVEPSGQIVYDSVGKNDIQYYYFPVKANAKYYVEVTKFEGYNHVWVDNATDWVTPIVNGNNSWNGTLKQPIVAGQNGFYYIAVRGEETSNFYRLRVYSEDPMVGGYQVHLTPKSITLPAGTSRTIFADCITPSGNIATASTSFQWASDNSALVSVTPGSMDASGFFRQATITAAASISEPTDTVVRVTANGITDRIAVRVIDMSQLYGNAAEQIQPDAAFPAQVSLGQDDWHLYWYQTEPGVHYRLTVTDSSGYVDVDVFSDPLLFEKIKNGNTSWNGSYTYDFVASSYNGTQFVLIKGKQSSNTASIQLNTVVPPSPTEVYYPRGTVKSLVQNTGLYYSRNTNSDLVPDIYIFVTDTEFALYTISVSDSAGYVTVCVADNILGIDPLKSGNTSWDGTFSYELVAGAPGKNYYVLVYGSESANSYSISLTKQ